MEKLFEVVSDIGGSLAQVFLFFVGIAIVMLPLAGPILLHDMLLTDGSNYSFPKKWSKKAQKSFGLCSFLALNIIQFSLYYLLFHGRFT